MECAHSCFPDFCASRSTPEFHYEGSSTANTKVGIWVDAVTLVEIGLGGERGHNYHLRVDTGLVETTTFVLDSTYIAEALRLEPLLKEYTKRPVCKPVYMVTEIMIAPAATIEIQIEAAICSRRKSCLMPMALEFQLG
jgi:hypothetical protein